MYRFIESVLTSLPFDGAWCRPDDISLSGVSPMWVVSGEPGRSFRDFPADEVHASFLVRHKTVGERQVVVAWVGGGRTARVTFRRTHYPQDEQFWMVDLDSPAPVFVGDELLHSHHELRRFGTTWLPIRTALSALNAFKLGKYAEEYLTKVEAFIAAEDVRNPAGVGCGDLDWGSFPFHPAPGMGGTVPGSGFGAHLYRLIDALCFDADKAAESPFRVIPRACEREMSGNLIAAHVAELMWGSKDPQAPVVRDAVLTWARNRQDA